MMVELHPSPQQPCFHVSGGFLPESAGSAGPRLDGACLPTVCTPWLGIWGACRVGELLQPGPQAWLVFTGRGKQEASPRCCIYCEVSDLGRTCFRPQTPVPTSPRHGLRASLEQRLGVREGHPPSSPTTRPLGAALPAQEAWTPGGPASVGRGTNSGGRQASSKPILATTCSCWPHLGKLFLYSLGSVFLLVKWDSFPPRPSLSPHDSP